MAKTNDIPRIVRGNDFTLKVNVKKPVLTMGATTLVDFSLEDCTDIRVMLVSQVGNRTEMPFSVSGSTLLIDFQETVASGLYGLEVTGKKDGKDWRYYAQPGELLEIVEPTSGAFIPSTDSEEGYYTVTAEIGVVSISEDIIKEQVNSIVDEKFAGALRYKGTVNADGDLPTDNKAGDTYVVQTKGTYDGKAMEAGDYLIWNGTSWDGLNGENQVENKDATLSAYDGTTPLTIATVDGTDITLKANGDQNKVDKENGTATNLTVQNNADSSALTIKANGYSGIKIVPRQPYNDLSPRARIMYEGKDSYIDIPTLQSGNDTLALQSQIQPTDTTLSSSSTNPIANKAVNSAIESLKEQIASLQSLISLCKVTVSTAEDFKTAIDSAAKSIVLGADISTTVTSIADKDIDLNGYTLDFDLNSDQATIDVQRSKLYNGAITTDCPLKLTDSTIDSASVTDIGGSHDAVIYAHGTTAISNGDITADGGSLECGIVVYGDTNLTVTDSSIAASWAGITQASKDAGATVTLNNATIKAPYEAVMLGSKSDRNMSTLTITGGSYTSTQGTPIVAVRTDVNINGAHLESKAATQSYTAYDFENQTELVPQSGAVGYAVALMGTNSTTAFAGTEVFDKMTTTVGYTGDDAIYYVRYNGTEAEKFE